MVAARWSRHGVRITTRPDLPTAFVFGAIAPVRAGLLLGVLTLLFGYLMGVTFGLNEDLIRDRLQASATAAGPTVYAADPAAADAVLEKSWSYMQRAHLHAGALGTATIALSLVLVMLGTGAALARTLSIALGAGGLGYSIFWMLAGFRAPGLGSTGAAKESLALLAIPSSGAVVLSTAIIAALLVAAIARPATHSGPQ